MTSVIFDPDARTEFLASVKYYEDCQHGLGNRFRLAIESATEKIQESPFRYRVLHAPFRRYLLQKFPFSLIYSIEPDHIRIKITTRKIITWEASGDEFFLNSHCLLESLQ